MQPGAVTHTKVIDMLVAKGYLAAPYPCEERDFDPALLAALDAAPRASLHGEAPPLQTLCENVIRPVLHGTNENLADQVRGWLGLTTDSAPVRAVMGSAEPCAENGCQFHRVSEAGEAPTTEITGDTSDGYHTFRELYAYRKAYNALLFNEWARRGLYDVHKSWKHHDGEPCFGGGWFIVVAQTPEGQISNHYKTEDWDLFRVPERERGNKWDGHTPQIALERLLTLAGSEAGEATPPPRPQLKFLTCKRCGCRIDIDLCGYECPLDNTPINERAPEDLEVLVYAFIGTEPAERSAPVASPAKPKEN